MIEGGVKETPCSSRYWAWRKHPPPRIFAEISRYKVRKVHFASASCDDTRLRPQHSPSPRELEICTQATSTWTTRPKTPLAAEGVVGVGVVPKDGTAQVGRGYQAQHLRRRYFLSRKPGQGYPTALHGKVGWAPIQPGLGKALVIDSLRGVSLFGSH